MNSTFQRLGMHAKNARLTNMYHASNSFFLTNSNIFKFSSLSWLIFLSIILTAPSLVDPLLSNALSLMQVCTMTINSASPQKTRIYEMGGQQTFPDCFFVAALLNHGWADGTWESLILFWHECRPISAIRNDITDLHMAPLFFVWINFLIY